VKIVFDLATPKQVRFFKPMMERLRTRGIRVATLTRRWGEVDLIRRSLGVKAKVLGRYGGGDLLGKLLCSSERVRLLAYHFRRIRPNLLVTLCNPESSRAAFGLGIPIVCFLDLPESEAASRLSLPLATRVCAPWIVPKREFQKYGVPARQVSHYRSLDPLVWLQDHLVRESYLEDLGLDSSKVFLVARETDWRSAYARTDLVNDIIERIARRHPDWQVVNIPRYQTHRFYDVPSLLARADAFLGGGGTMCIEAAYYGTPVVATRPMQSRYMQWLFDRGLADKASTAEEAVRRIETIVAGRNGDRARKLRAAGARSFRGLDFPLEEVVDLIIGTAKA
jgi:hypothetical protein